jgi:hypothetical protein
MVGGYALRYALNYPAIGLVTAIGRRSLGIWHPKLIPGRCLAASVRRRGRLGFGARRVQ